MKIETIDPSEVELIEAFEALCDSGLETRSQGAEKSARKQAKRELSDRHKFLLAASQQLRAPQFELVAKPTPQSGKFAKGPRDMESGSNFVNGRVVSDSRIPFCDVKESGISLELSACGRREFVGANSLWIS